MALVSYSDSEASDSESELKTPVPAPAPAAATSSSTATPNFHSIVDRSNPRKIRVALPSLKPENPEDSEDGPARKKLRTGGGGTFSGFNSFLPAPKRANATANATAAEKKAPVRKVFSLKTGAAPGFDREADAEMRKEQAFAALSGGGGDADDEFIPKAGSLREESTESALGAEDGGGGIAAMKNPEELKLKGNPMMFKPLSVGRAQPKKKRVIAGANITTATAIGASSTSGGSQERKGGGESNAQIQSTASSVPAPAPKPKVSLFSLSSTDDSAPTTTSLPTRTQAYEPLVYTASESTPSAGPEPESESRTTTGQLNSGAAYSSQPQTLNNIADDLNLSRAQRRHLFGRHADSSKSRILHFNTDQEYAANQELLHQADASVQHNPVRAIAPGKHTLQQLVNSAQTQREALEESFASGKRNKKEAGAKYGW